MLKDALFSALTVIVVVVAGGDRSGRRARAGLPDPTLAGANPRPEWPFLWLFALLSLSPPGGGNLHHPGLPGAPDRRPVPRAVRHPTAANAPRAAGRWPCLSVDRDLHGARRADLPGCHRALVAGDDRLERRRRSRKTWSRRSTPLQLQGAVVLQNKNCRNCHALEGIGGRRGPDLSGVGTRLTRDQLIDQISNGTPGGGNMPAYGKQIKPGRDDRPGRVPGQPAPAGPAAGPPGRDQPAVTTARPR